MFEASKRVNYHELLKPPPGYRVEFAIITSYSIDMAAVLLASLSISGIDYEDTTNAISDPISLLKSIMDLKDRLVVFCQDTRMNATMENNLLWPFYSKVIVPVQTPKGVSFHPKVWILKMRNSTGVLYRFICLSRNMTFDKSWDVAFSIEGEVKGTEKNSDISAMIKDLISYGKNQLDESVVAKMKEIQKEISFVDFEVPEAFLDSRGVDFIYCKPDEALKTRIRGEFNRMLIISPFIDIEALRLLSDKSGETYLISAESQLDKLLYENKEEAVELLKSFYAVKFINDAVEGDETDENIDGFRGLHAKIIIAQAGGDTNYFIGSANATSRGLKGINYEFVVKAVTNQVKNRPNELLSKGTALSRLLCDYEIKIPAKIDDTRKIEDKMDAIVKNIMSCCEVLEVTCKESNYYFTLKLNKTIEIDKDVEIECWYLGSHVKDKVILRSGNNKREIEFGIIEETSISPFIKFRINHKILKVYKEFIHKISINGVPDSIEEKIIKKIIDNKKAFLQYIALLFGDVTKIGKISNKPPGGGGGGGGINSNNTQLSIGLEDMLHCFADNPDNLKNLGTLLDDLKKSDVYKDVVPEEFTSLWESFKLALSVPYER